jgi:hypothetical protein
MGGLNPGLHFFARGSFLFLDLRFYLLEFLLQVFLILLEHVQILLSAGKGLQPVEVEINRRKTKVESPGSPTPHLCSPPELVTPEKLNFSGAPDLLLAISGVPIKGAKQIFTGAKLVFALAGQDDGGIYPVYDIFYQ